MGVVVRRYIDYLTLLIPTPLVFVLLCNNIYIYIYLHIIYIYRTSGLLVPGGQPPLNALRTNVKPAA